MRFWHKADTLNVGFWGQSGQVTNAAYQPRFMSTRPNSTMQREPERLPDRLRSPLMKTALVIVGLLALLGVTIGWAIWGWQQIAGTAMGFHGWLAMILGVVFTVVVGCGLMGLMFYSSRYGYDERATDLSDKDKSER